MMMLSNNGAENSGSAPPMMMLSGQPLVFTTDGSNMSSMQSMQSMQPMPQYFPVYTTGAPMDQRQWMMPYGSVMPSVPQMAYSTSMPTGSPSFGFQTSTQSTLPMLSPPTPRQNPQAPAPLASVYRRPTPPPTKLPQRTQRRGGRPRKNPAPEVAPFSRLVHAPYTAGINQQAVDLDDDLDLDVPAPGSEKPEVHPKWSLEEEFTIVESHSKFGDNWEAVWASLPNPTKYTPAQVELRWLELSNEQPSTRPKRNPVSAYGDDMISIDEAIGEMEAKKPRKRPPAHNADLTYSAKRQKPNTQSLTASSSVFVDHTTELHSKNRDAKWTIAEDGKLVSWVQQHGSNSWELAAATLHGKTANECRERWEEQYNPDVNKGRFTEQEDEAILKFQFEMGPAWDDIARRMGTKRTGSDVLKRHKNLMRETSFRGSAGTYARKIHARVLRTVQVDHLDPEPEPEPIHHSQRRNQQSYDEYEASNARQESVDSRQHSAMAGDDDDMEVSLPFDAPELLSTLPSEQPAKRGRGRPRKQPPKVDPNDDIDQIIEQHLNNAGVSKSAESDNEGRSQKFEVPTVDSVDDIGDINEVKAKYAQLTGMFKNLAEEHTKAVHRRELSERYLLQQISEQKNTINSLKAIKFVDVGQATIKLVSHDDPAAVEHPGVAL